MRSTLRTLILGAALSVGTMAASTSEAHPFRLGRGININIGWGSGSFHLNTRRPFIPVYPVYPSYQPVYPHAVPVPVVPQPRVIYPSYGPRGVIDLRINRRPRVRFDDDFTIRRGGLKYKYKFNKRTGQYYLKDIDD